MGWASGKKAHLKGLLMARTSEFFCTDTGKTHLEAEQAADIADWFESAIVPAKESRLPFFKLLPKIDRN